MHYIQHFGLREAPFGITPDTSFFYACRSVKEALSTLLVAVAGGEGFIKLTGEVGTGKTLLCRKFLSAFDDRFAKAYIPNPNLEPKTLLIALAEELGVTIDPGLDQHHLIKSLHLALLNFARQNKRIVVCLDETQAMPLETLETLRLLTNLETEKRKLLQVVLFGQPELDQKLAHESIRQLRQRITFQHRLGGLSHEETDAYIRHRLAVAGYNGEPIFNEAAVRAIDRASRGVPRLVNILAHKSMMAAYGVGAREVTRDHVREAVRDTPAAVERELRPREERPGAGNPAGLINGMLRDLSRRNAIHEAADVRQLQKQVRSGRSGGLGSEWFWRSLAALILVALSWVGWVIWQLSPHSVVTEQALRAAPARPASAQPALPQAPSAAGEANAEAGGFSLPEVPDRLRLATELTPPAPRPARPAPVQKPEPPAPATEKAGADSTDSPAPQHAEPASQ